MPKPPQSPNLYHIVHISRLPSIIKMGKLLSDNNVRSRNLSGTQIVIPQIKKVRATKSFSIYPNLHVGDCVPFYFCPRSIMLYIIFRRNHPNLPYAGGQNEIIHLKLNLHSCVNWANGKNIKWIFTDCNATTTYATEYNHIKDLNKLDWQAIQAKDWSAQATREAKQSEFLIEDHVDFNNVIKVGVNNKTTYQQVVNALNGTSYTPIVKIHSNWYY